MSRKPLLTYAAPSAYKLILCLKSCKPVHKKTKYQTTKDLTKKCWLEVSVNQNFEIFLQNLENVSPKP